MRFDPTPSPLSSVEKPRQGADCHSRRKVNFTPQPPIDTIPHRRGECKLSCFDSSNIQPRSFTIQLGAYSCPPPPISYLRKSRTLHPLSLRADKPLSFSRAVLQARMSYSRYVPALPVLVTLFPLPFRGLSYI